MRTVLHYLLVCLGLFGYWVVLSGKLDAVHLAMGAVSAAFVAALSGSFLYTEGREPGRRRWMSLLPWWRLAVQFPYLTWEIVKANIALIRLILAPSRLRPRIVRIPAPRMSEIGRFALANFITVTPGTLTVDVTEDELVVHALDAASARALQDGELVRRIAWIFDAGQGA